MTRTEFVAKLRDLAKEQETALRATLGGRAVRAVDFEPAPDGSIRVMFRLSVITP